MGRKMVKVEPATRHGPPAKGYLPPIPETAIFLQDIEDSFYSPIRQDFL